MKLKGNSPLFSWNIDDQWFVFPLHLLISLVSYAANKELVPGDTS